MLRYFTSDIPLEALVELREGRAWLASRIAMAPSETSNSACTFAGSIGNRRTKELLYTCGQPCTRVSSCYWGSANDVAALDLRSHHRDPGLQRFNHVLLELAFNSSTVSECLYMTLVGY